MRILIAGAFVYGELLPIIESRGKLSTMRSTSGISLIKKSAYGFDVMLGSAS